MSERRRAAVRTLVCLSILGTAIGSLGFTSRQASVVLDRSVWDSVYSAPQAGRGESVYAKACARCHGATLSGANEAPPLSGGAFLGNWDGLALSELEARIRTTMPSDSIGTVNRTQSVTVMAYLLKVNGFPAGQADLPEAADSLKGILLKTTKP